MHGLPGRNISCDLHMEHLNREVKTAIKGLGANKSSKAIMHTGKVIGVLTNTLTEIDKNNDISADHGAHAIKSADKDLAKIQKQLTNYNNYTIISIMI